MKKKSAISANNLKKLEGGPLDQEQPSPRNLIFVLRDEKAKSFGFPLIHPTADVAVRSLAMAVGNSQSTLSKFPQDYTLWLCGSFDERTAAFDLLPEYQFVINAGDLAQKPVEASHAVC